MINVIDTVYHAKWVGDKGVMLWAEKEDEILHIDDWKSLLFARHEESFYGTFLNCEKNSLIFLSPWSAVKLFSNYPSFFIKQENWSASAWEMIETARIIMKAVLNKQVKPDFAAWKAGVWGWAVQGIDHVPDWVNAALDNLAQSEPEMLDAEEEFFDRFPFEHLLEQATIYDTLSEETWLAKIGWKKDLAPFYTIFKLIEPEEDERHWNVKLMLQEKKGPLSVEWTDSIRDLPEEWAPYQSRVTEDLKVASELVPFLRNKDGTFKRNLTELQAWDFLNEKSELLNEAGLQVVLPEWWEALKELQPTLKAKVKSASSKYASSFVGLHSIIQFDWKLSTGEIELSEEEFMKLVDSKRRLIKIRGKWFKLDPAFIKEVKQVMKSVDKNGLQLKDILEQHLLKGAETDEQEDTSQIRHFSIELNQYFAKMIEQLTEVKSIPVSNEAKGFNGSLREYQKVGSSWMQFFRKFGLGCCLADDMGLGKTIQTINYLLHVKENEESDVPALLICPTSVIGNWQKELKQFGPDLNVYLHYGGNRAKGDQFAKSIQEADVVITSYTTAQLDEEEISKVIWNAIVLDEAQNIKNSFTKQSKTIRRMKGRHKIALTGTPVENRLLELWSIFDFLNPGYLGSEAAFRKRFVLPVERENDNARLNQLKRLVQPFLLRRTKQDSIVQLNLPDKQEIKEYCHLTAEQASLYERIIQDTFKQLEELTGMKRRGLILAMLGKLKQICDHPALFLKEEKGKRLDERSNKFAKMVELLEAIRDEGERCLIFTQFISMGNMIREFLEKKWGEPVLYLHGSVPKAKRDEMIERFQSGENGVFILSLKAGGTGLNLTEANHVIHFDRWWNPAVENQATDRAHRIGQKRFVRVHKLITLGTLEERIDEMLENKKELSEKVISSENWITELSTSELRELFALRKEWVDE